MRASYFFGVALIFSFSALAGTPASYSWRVQYGDGTNQAAAGSFSTLDAACSVSIPNRNTILNLQGGERAKFCYSTASPPNGSCYGNSEQTADCATGVVLLSLASHVGICPAGQIKSGTYPNEVCNAGACPAAYTPAGSYYVAVGDSLFGIYDGQSGVTYCDAQGCEVSTYGSFEKRVG